MFVFFCVHHCKEHFLHLISFPQFTCMIYRIFIVISVRSFFSSLIAISLIAFITARIIFSINFISAVHVFVVISLRSILQILCRFQRVYCGNCLKRASFRYLTIILRNRAEYHLILSRRGRRPSWLNQGIFRKIEQDNCFIIQQILINYHFHNEKNYGSMMKTLKASNT